MKKFIKLINNERLCANIISNKATSDCASDSIDYCPAMDQADCSLYASDKCNSVDLAACFQGAHDYCEGTYDTKACIGPGVVDD